jgi:hypothetical protein
MTNHKIIELDNTTPVRLTPNGIHSGMDITIQNINASGYIYIGGEGLTSSSFGYRVAPDHAISFELPGTDFLYALASENEMSIAIIKTNLESGS